MPLIKSGQTVIGDQIVIEAIKKTLFVIKIVRGKFINFL